MAKEIEQNTTTSSEVATHVAKPEGLAMLGVDPGIFIAQLVNFCVVLFVLKRWVFGPIIARLNERTATIERSQKQAQEIEQRLKSLDEEQAKRLKQAEEQARLILEKAHAEATLQANEMIEKGKREVERIVVKGRAQLKIDQETMLRDAKQEMVEIIVTAVSKILDDGLDEKRATSLAEEVVRKMTRV